MYMPKLFFRQSVALGVLILIVTACDNGDGIVTPVDQADGRITITNDEGAMAGRMIYPGTPVPIDDPLPGLFPAQASAGPQTAPKKKELELTLEAEISPPSIDGATVQATSVALQGYDKVMVSYNMRGAPRLGAIDWITKLTKKPKISASATFNDTDVSALSMDGVFVYAAASTEPVEFPFPAVLERLRLKKDKFVLDDNLRVPLTSYVGTSTLVTKREVYATSGNGGHVFAFDKESLKPLGEYPLDDARWVAWDEDGDRVVVAQGTPGRLSVFAEGEFSGGSMTPPQTFSFPGADVPESKSTVEISGGKAFIAAGPEGVQIVCLDNGEVIGSVPRPDPASLGLDPSVVVTNAVTVDDDVMFISNGEAGIYVAQSAEKFKSSGCAQQEITVLGKLRFDDLESANHVEFKNKWLIVAAGLGGVKVVKVDNL